MGVGVCQNEHACMRIIYECITTDGQELMVNSPADLPEVNVWFGGWVECMHEYA